MGEKNAILKKKSLTASNNDDVLTIFNIVLMCFDNFIRFFLTATKFLPIITKYLIS